MSEYDEFVTVHNPNIFPYNVLLAHEDEDTGEESIGTGVMVGLGGHHLIATAAHCIRRNPRVMREDNFFINQYNKMATSPPVKILERWLHPDLDIGFLKVGEALGLEMNEGQLYCGLIKGGIEGGLLHVVGYPACRKEVNERLRDMTLVKSVFGSIVIEQTDSSLKLDYPKTGFRDEGGRWIEEPFIERPHGFSGGGCFGVNLSCGDVPAVGYKLVEIQCAWHPSERWVEVVPIRYWLDGVKSQFGQRDRQTRSHAARCQIPGEP